MSVNVRLSRRPDTQCFHDTLCVCVVVVEGGGGMASTSFKNVLQGIKLHLTVLASGIEGLGMRLDLHNEHPDQQPEVVCNP